MKTKTVIIDGIKYKHGTEPDRFCQECHKLIHCDLWYGDLNDLCNMESCKNCLQDLDSKYICHCYLDTIKVEDPIQRQLQDQIKKLKQTINDLESEYINEVKHNRFSIRLRDKVIQNKNEEINHLKRELKFAFSLRK